jgi:hypothetical protein
METNLRNPNYAHIQNYPYKTKPLLNKFPKDPYNDRSQKNYAIGKSNYSEFNLSSKK